MEGQEPDLIRSDVKEARATPGRVKAVLVYKDEDVLDTGMQKVQPLQYLDEEILKYKEEIESSVSAAEEVNDDLPQNILSKVNHVIKVATEGKTTLFKASSLLEFTSEAFQYARRSMQNKFDLSRKSGEILDSYDQSFHKMMDARLVANMDEAQDSEEICLQYLEQAIKEAGLDCSAWVEQSEDEKKQLEKIGDLEEVQDEVRTSIRDEISELEMIRDQCSKDTRKIDSELELFKVRMDRATSDYLREEQAKIKRLTENRREQERLREKLAMLEKEESKLDREVTAGKSQGMVAVDAREKAAGEVKEWREKIMELKNRAETLLKVMREMSDVTEMILNDAKKRKQASKLKLNKLELEGLLYKRNAFMAQGVMFKIIESDCEGNVVNTAQELARLQTERRQAARTGYKKKVLDINNSIESYTSEKTRFTEKGEDIRKRLEEVIKEMERIDDKIKKLDPQIKLDQVEERFKKRKETIDKIFTNESTDGIKFISNQ